jgi:hypothetical protein
MAGCHRALSEFSLFRVIVIQNGRIAKARKDENATGLVKASCAFLNLSKLDRVRYLGRAGESIAKRRPIGCV